MTNPPRTAGIFRELHAVVVPVTDLDASLAWYRETLGLEPRRVIDGALAVLGTGGPTNVCLYVPGPDGTKGTCPTGTFPNFRAEDIAATRARLVDHGVTCSEVLGGGGVEFFTCHDPDGNRIDVCAFGDDWLA